MSNGPLGYLLAFMGLFLVVFLGESFGPMAACIPFALWCFLCQFLRSRGDAEAHRQNWRGMVLVAVLPIGLATLNLLLERGPGRAQGLLILVFGLPGVYAGAYTASVLARKRAARS
jgi:hypothetical protein